MDDLIIDRVGFCHVDRLLQLFQVDALLGEQVGEVFLFFLAGDDGFAVLGPAVHGILEVGFVGGTGYFDFFEEFGFEVFSGLFEVVSGID